MRKLVVISAALLVAALCLVAISSAVTVFVIQPIGAIPNGATLVIWRRENTRFIDSADAVCVRETGGVNLLCRAGVLAGVAKGDLLLKLPYSHTLYLLSTGGNTYAPPDQHT